MIRHEIFLSLFVDEILTTVINFLQLHFSLLFPGGFISFPFIIFHFLVKRKSNMGI